jgi:hypothetical protein
VENDASLRCGGSGCAGAPLERTERVGHGHGTFWAVTLLEAAGAIAPSFVGTRQANGALAPWAVLVTIPSALLLVGDLVLGSIGYVSGAMGTHEDDWRLNVPLQADWKGARVPLSLVDVIPDRSQDLPKSFSVARAAERQGTQVKQPGEKEPEQKLVKAGSGTLAVLRLRPAGSSMVASEVDRLTSSIHGTMVRSTGFTVWASDVVASKCGSDCDEASDLDIGVKVGATLVLSSNALRTGDKTIVTLRLSDVATGAEVGRQKAVASSETDLDQRVREATLELAAQATGTRVTAAQPPATGRKAVRVAVPDFVAKGAGFTASELTQLAATARAVLATEGASEGMEPVGGGEASQATLSGEALKFGSLLRATVKFSSGAGEGPAQSASGKNLEELRASVKDAVRKLVAGGLPAGVTP